MKDGICHFPGVLVENSQLDEHIKNIGGENDTIYRDAKSIKKE